ncbi:MAG: helix-turn-helix transcriptional regulator [Crocosphaera sp.]|nr:helix-turn-helix transcriptional regulator [Crocosphaera sp.]
MKNLLGKKLREVREARGLSQRQLAESVKISPSYLCKIERGCTYYPPSQEIIIKLESILKTGKHELLNLGGRIDRETWDDYIFLVKKYPEMTQLINKMANDPKFAEEIIAQVSMEHLL